MSVTTRTGDDGYTNLLNGKRVHKFDLRVDLMGSIDELTSHLGVVKSSINTEEVKNEIEEIQHCLSTIMAQIAYGNHEKYNISNDEIDKVESAILNYESMYISENKFIMPGKTKTSAVMDLARAVTRRIERQILSVDRFYPVHENCKRYINRVSDYLYTSARFVDFKEDITLKVKELLKDENKVAVKADLTSNRITLKLAKMVIEEVEAKAEEMGLPVVISVANEWGNTIAVHFMDGALPASYDIAVNKAFTSAAVRLTTEEVGQLSRDGQPLYGIGNTNQNRIVTFGGGYPLKIKNAVAGGIGVSGGTAEQDIGLAAYGAEIFKKFSE